ncbi:MAG: hypothetical protein HRT90_04075 [Candidatus Margulisbacteria bacterium]|nr:hypothetical protein [Candidatus Margulisiibacteriota bacterium]
MMGKSKLTKYDKAFLWKLMAISGVCWTVAEILMIKIGFQESVTTVPFIALCAGFAWKIHFTFYKPQQMPQWIINIVWLGLELVLIYQFLTFSSDIWIGALIPGMGQMMIHLCLFAITSGICFLLISAMSQEFEDTEKGAYSAFSINLLMSVLFINLLLTRGSVAGQSIYILGFMMLGTLIPAYCFYRGYPKSKFLNTLYLTTFLVDIIYATLLIKMHMIQGINPFLRF